MVRSKFPFFAFSSVSSSPPKASDGCLCGRVVVVICTLARSLSNCGSLASLYRGASAASMLSCMLKQCQIKSGHGSVRGFLKRLRCSLASSTTRFRFPLQRTKLASNRLYSLPQQKKPLLAISCPKQAAAKPPAKAVSREIHTVTTCRSL